MAQRKIKKPAPSIEEMYQAAREARAAKCKAAIDEALKTHNCKLDIVVQIGGGQQVTLDQVLGLPSGVQVTPN